MRLRRSRRHCYFFIIFAALLLVPSPFGLSESHQQSLKTLVSWGHESVTPQVYSVKLSSASPGVEIRDARPFSLESGEGMQAGSWTTRAGGGDVDGVEFTLVFPEDPGNRLQNLHILWADLIAASDPDTAMRLGDDPAFYPGSPKLTVEMNDQGTRGFSVSPGQLLTHGSIWIPTLDIYLTVGDRFTSFSDHQRELEKWKGKRVLDVVQASPDATYEEYVSLWEDMGHPDYDHAQQRGPGHIVGLSWDSTIHKFGVDRGAGVRPDYGNPDGFRFWFSFGDIRQGIRKSWKSQGLQDGLPFVTTVFEEGTRYEVEQFAYPLNGPPGERRGDIPMVLLQKVRVTDLTGKARQQPITLTHRRKFPEYSDSDFEMEESGGKIVFRESAFRQGLLAIEGVTEPVAWSGVRDYQRELRRMDATVMVELPANGTREFVVKLPSPPVPTDQHETLLAIDYERARSQTHDFWMGWVNRGAQFEVPEKVVNDLFRATLWHALRLPRRHGGETGEVKIDLPYSNFAYGQVGTPWPVLAGVYVDYMLHDLRGYHEVSVEELLAIYRNNQEQDGHLTGVVNWVVYTPGMLYAVGNNYLLTRDREAFSRLLPYTLKTLDWCLGEMSESPKGLVSGPLNDGTGVGIWALNQAYIFAGLDRFGLALKDYGHHRAEETLKAAQESFDAIDDSFRRASTRSTIVQLKDHTWIPYVPCEAKTPRRILEQWYATDIDTGAVHLPRLKAIAPDGDLADYLLHDHEDNLYYRNRGIANEPVYNQQTSAYLWRDDPKSVIRGFYSYITSAFSHSALEPVEHRWTHGQYFGPPSTDGAWFEVYRNMLVQERDDETLLLAQATPRRWLEDGKKIKVENAPTFFGKVSLTIQSEAGSGRIVAQIISPQRNCPAAIVMRLRHPEKKSIQSVTVNGQSWKGFDKEEEWIRIENPREERYEIVATY